LDWMQLDIQGNWQDTIWLG